MATNVLIADDDQAIRSFIIKILNGLGVESPTEASDGAEALALFQQNQFDLVLLDWDMPGKSGLEVLQAIRALPSDVPVIMVTGETKKDRVLEAAEAGVTNYLVKPIDPEAFKEKLAPYCQVSGPTINTSVYRCRNVMNPDVITVSADATVGEATALLLEHSISGMPVVDADNRLLGIITEYNLIQSITQPDIKVDPVSSVMSTEVMTVDENTIPLKVVSIMQKHRVRRVPVVRGDQLVGLISRRDILRYVTENEEVLRGFLEELKSLAAKQPSS